MESDSWSDRLSAALKHSEAALQSYSDLYMELEDIDGEEDTRGWFPCPFCSEAEDFDIIGICRHIDDEHFGMKNGVCPVCAMRVGMDMVAHITMQHGHLFKISFFYFVMLQ
ncbi:hypothetical protein NE237_015600 [Protea cynaroides]|uniref:Di19 zinc-binding domain-containing protein n=1 Tax=Protea cynaroides TaxID=273540 RepID=A0A9Q0KEC9_9MAGN|nr:hypothetical protein NE237_015600 [Protea cynaroides]